MQALMSRTPGGPETLVLEDVPDPVPGPGQVRVRVEACGANFPDTLIIEDKYQFRPARPFSPGSEVAGVIDAVGPAVSSDVLGQRVAGWTSFGGMAGAVVLDAASWIPVPDSMNFQTASAFLMTYGTSLYALKDRARLRPGETLLVLGAAGGVGLAAIELGKTMGARVIAAASSPEKADLALAHGADEAIVYPAGPFDLESRKELAKLVKTAVGSSGADVIYDPVGGDYSEAALRAIAWGGRFLVIGFPAGIARLPLNLILLKGCDVLGVFWGTFTQQAPDRNRQNNLELTQMFEKGQIRPDVTEVFTLDRAGEALAKLARREARGKLVIDTRPSAG